MTLFGLPFFSGSLSLLLSHDMLMNTTDFFLTNQIFMNNK